MKWKQATITGVELEELFKEMRLEGSLKEIHWEMTEMQKV